MKILKVLTEIVSKLFLALNPYYQYNDMKKRTYMNIGLSLINNSTADRFPNIMFITRKKNTPTLQQESNNEQ